MQAKEEVFVQNEQERTKVFDGDKEYLDESMDSRRLSEKWDMLICQKLAKREEQKKSLLKVAQTELPKSCRRYSSFDSFGSLSIRVCRTLEALSSFGGRQDPEIAVEKNTQGPKSRHHRASKRPSIMDMIISFTNKSTNKEAEGAVKEAQISSMPMQGARKRVAFARTVSSIKNKSTPTASPSKKDSSQNKDVRAKESLGHGDTEAVNNFHHSKTVQGRSKKRGSLIKLVNSIKCMTVTDNKEKGGHKHQPRNQDSSRRSKPNRRRATEGSLRCSAKKFTQIAIHGSLIDANEKAATCAKDTKVNLGGEDSYNEKISSILYTDSPCTPITKGRARRHTK